MRDSKAFAEPIAFRKLSVVGEYGGERFLLTWIDLSLSLSLFDHRIDLSLTRIDSMLATICFIINLLSFSGTVKRCRQTIQLAWQHFLLAQEIE